VNIIELDGRVGLALVVLARLGFTKLSTRAKTVWSTVVLLVCLLNPQVLTDAATDMATERTAAVNEVVQDWLKQHPFVPTVPTTTTTAPAPVSDPP
jgi:hypothetical protein